MRIFAVSLLLAVVASAAPPIISQDFESDDTGWMVFGGEGKIQVTHDHSQVKNGKGALEFRYVASSSKPALAVFPVGKSLTGMKSLNLWLMADSDTAAAVLFVEKNGGHYAAIFALEANVWQRVELTPADFLLATGANDPKDPDGKLDFDQIEAVAMLDLTQTFGAASGDGHAQLAIEERSGAHKMWADDFEISTTSPTWAARKPALLVDDFLTPQSNWITLGGASLKVDASGSVVKGNALRIDCNQMAEKLVVVTRMLSAGTDLTGATHVGFDIAADKPAHLVLAFQEHSAEPEGPRYHADFEVPGGNQSVHREVALADFEIDDDGPVDPNHKLDLNKLKSFSIVNVTAAFTGEEGVNTIRIGKIEAVTHK